MRPRGTSLRRTAPKRTSWARWCRRRTAPGRAASRRRPAAASGGRGRRKPGSGRARTAGRGHRATFRTASMISPGRRCIGRRSPVCSPRCALSNCRLVVGRLSGGHQTPMVSAIPGRAVAALEGRVRRVKTSLLAAKRTPGELGPGPRWPRTAPASAWAGRRAGALTGPPSSSTVQVPQTWTSQERLAPVELEAVAQHVEQLISLGSTCRLSAVVTLTVVSMVTHRRPVIGAPGLSHASQYLLTKPSRYSVEPAARRPRGLIGQRPAHGARDRLEFAARPSGGGRRHDVAQGVVDPTTSTPWLHQHGATRPEGERHRRVPPKSRSSGPASLDVRKAVGEQHRRRASASLQRGVVVARAPWRRSVDACGRPP